MNTCYIFFKKKCLFYTFKVYIIMLMHFKINININIVFKLLILSNRFIQACYFLFIYIESLRTTIILCFKDILCMWCVTIKIVSCMHACVMSCHVVSCRFVACIHPSCNCVKKKCL